MVLLYVINLVELNHHLPFAIEDENARWICVGAYNMFFILMLLLTEKYTTKEGTDLRDAFAFWGVLAVFVYLVLFHNSVIEARDSYFFGSTPIGFNLHYALVALLIFVCAISIRKVKKLKEFNIRTSNAYSWFYVAFFVFLASTELDNIVLLISGASDNIYEVLDQNHKIGWPILWGVTSFVLIFVGLQMKLRHLRIISLTLFLITLIKLFAVDIQGISEGGKIAAFISLGVLLLVVSFMYQRLKKLLMKDEEDAKPVVVPESNESNESGEIKPNI